MPKHKLTTDNIQAKTEYEKYVTNKLNEYDIWNHVHELHWKAVNGQFMDDDEIILNELDGINVPSAS